MAKVDSRDDEGSERILTVILGVAEDGDVVVGENFLCWTMVSLMDSSHDRIASLSSVHHWFHPFTLQVRAVLFPSHLYQ